MEWGHGERRFGVQSFAAEPALELLLRAAMGGRTTGRAVVPVSTPADGLIAVGQVAKKYGLYTKITGGQRVDLFGARVEQLPSIWEELIAAFNDRVRR